MHFQDIPTLTRGTYEVNCSLAYLSETIARYQDGGTAHSDLNLLPDFQRGHVWTRLQQIAFVEFFLKGGMSGRVLYFNCPNWGHFCHIPKGEYNEFVIVDGLQRLTALLKFINGKLPIYGNWVLPKGQIPLSNRTYFEGRIRQLNANDNLLININHLQTRDEVLQWYLEMNTGGTQHTKKEIEKVRKMRAESIV